ncbi:MAG: ATP-binding cassette domain-containing protein, partial [SAR324 cluster bacterium]|nr:ATP-binding cassette domain-containing protein [SAR324 cluster bacterium]
MLALDGIQCQYGSVRVLDQVSLRLDRGEILGLLGRNGAGKTTLLKTIMGLVPPVAGSVQLDGNDLTGLPAHEIPKHGIGYVPQGRRLFPWLTVAENLKIGLLVRNSSADTL